MKKKKAVFIHIPKTAGRSVVSALGFKASAKTHHLTDVPHEFEDYFRFCFVRDPVERFKSAYFYTLRGLNEMDWANKPKVLRASPIRKAVLDNELYTFSKFCSYCKTLDDTWILNNLHFKPQTHWIRKTRPQFIGRFENIESDFSYVSRFLGLKKKLPVTNKTVRDLDKMARVSWFEERYIKMLYELDYDLLYSKQFIGR